MSIFSKLFAASKQREEEKCLVAVGRFIDDEVQPLRTLGYAIFRASSNCLDAVKTRILEADETKRLLQEQIVLYEFIYFFMHITRRTAFSVMTKAQLEKLESFLGPMVSGLAVNMYCGHWPDDLRNKIRDEFFEKLNAQEAEYAESSQSPSTKTGDDRNVEIMTILFVIVSTNVVWLLGLKSDDPLATTIMNAAIKEWKEVMPKVYSLVRTL